MLSFGFVSGHDFLEAAEKVWPLKGPGFSLYILQPRTPGFSP